MKTFNSTSINYKDFNLVLNEINDSILNDIKLLKYLPEKLPTYSSRENDHLKVCLRCRNELPIYIIWSCVFKQCDIHESLDLWYTMSEHKRHAFMNKTRRRVNIFIKRIYKYRVLTNYQIFLKYLKHNNDIKESSHKFETMCLRQSMEWKSLNVSNKYMFTDASTYYKEQVCILRKFTPLFLRRIINVKFKKNTISTSKNDNGFLKIVSRLWDTEKRYNRISYKNFLKNVSTKWKSMELN
jgi:hypothetical protein